MTNEEKAEEIASKRCRKMFCYTLCNVNKNHHCGVWHYNKECTLEGIEYGLAEGRKESEKDLQTAIKANNAWLKKDTALEEENEQLKAKLKRCAETISEQEETIDAQDEKIDFYIAKMNKAIEEKEILEAYESHCDEIEEDAKWIAEENARLKAEKQQMQEQVKKIILDENAEIGDLRKIVGMDWYDVKEIEQLKADLEEARSHCKEVDEVNAKLRCCDNCKHVKYDWDDQLRIGKCKTCERLSNWEMRE